MNEGRTIEFKREYTEDIKKTIVAFANSDGGIIYIGIQDDGSVIGLVDVDDTILRLSNASRDAIRPDITLFIEYNIEVMEGKKIVSVIVQRGTSRPYYIAQKGLRPEGVYVRQGASTAPATEVAILNMIKDTSGDCYEKARSLEQNLTFEKTESYFKKESILFKEQQKLSLGLLGNDATYTNLALLLSEQCLHTVRLALFEGNKKAIFKERKEFSGSLLSQTEEVYEYLEHYNRTRSEFKGLERIDRKDYPSDALREALLNAIVHRDYSFSASTLISMFDDRIEIVSVGGLIKGITFRDISLGISILRNQNLANIFYRLKLIEAYGTGVPKIMNSYDDFILKPKFEVTDNAFKITLPNRNYNDSTNMEKSISDKNTLTARESQVIELFNNRDFIVRKDVEDATNVSQATAITLLRDMTRKKVLRKEGMGKLIKYRLGN